MGKILVIRGGAIGDFILTLPAIRLLVEDLPQAEVEIMGYESIIALAQAGGYTKQTRSIEYGALAPFFAKGASLDDGLSAYFASFSVVVSYLYDPDHHFRDNLQRAGVETLIECSHRVDHQGAPAAEQLARPLEELALLLDESRRSPQLNLDDSTQALGDAHLEEEARPWIALHPGSGSPYKNWPLVRWLDVAERLHESHPEARLLISTGEAEDEPVADFLEALQRKGLPHRRANRWPLPVLGAALSRCALYLGHDSGISHLAAAVGTPTITLFGPTMSPVWAPTHAHARVIEHPSGLLSEITAHEVIKAAEGLLGSR